MAYDRYDRSDGPHSDRSRWRDDRGEGRGWRSDRETEGRGFFERAGDEIASWFGDDDAERRRRDERGHGWSNPDRDPERSGFFGDDRDSGDRSWRERSWSSRGDERRDEDFRSRGRPAHSYRPVTGDYGRSGEYPDSEQFFAASGVPRGGIGGHRDDRFERERPRRAMGREQYGRDEFSSRGSSREGDPHYHSWRSRHMSELDRDYEDYRRENQSRFEDDFANWRQRRQEKRSLLGEIREHMNVVGSDDEHVGTVDRVAGDRLILTKSDPESGGVHHSISCADVDRVEGDRVILDCKADEAKHRWRDEHRSRALFEREDQGEMGPRVLDRSFEGTYRD
jgi:hypothetical protein